MPIAIFLEFQRGNVEGAVALTIVFLALSAVYLSLFRKVGLMTRGQVVARQA